MANPEGKTRKVGAPYEVWVQPSPFGGIMTTQVLKYNNAPHKRDDQYSSAFCAVQSAATFGSYDMGDTYITDFTHRAEKVYDYRTDDENTLAEVLQAYWEGS